MSDITITPDLTMEDVLRLAPAAQRALFQRYHIGGCSHCAFQPTDTLGPALNMKPRANPSNTTHSSPSIRNWAAQYDAEVGAGNGDPKGFPCPLPPSACGPSSGQAREPTSASPL